MSILYFTAAVGICVFVVSILERLARSDGSCPGHR